MQQHNKESKIQSLIKELNELRDYIDHFYAVQDPLYRDYEKSAQKVQKELTKLLGAH